MSCNLFEKPRNLSHNNFIMDSSSSYLFSKKLSCVYCKCIFMIMIYLHGWIYLVVEKLCMKLYKVEWLCYTFHFLWFSQMLHFIIYLSIYQSICLSISLSIDNEHCIYIMITNTVQMSKFKQILPQKYEKLYNIEIILPNANSSGEKYQCTL